MCIHTWEELETYQIQTQNQAKQDDWSKEIWKKCTIEVIQTTTNAQLSLSESTHMSIHMYYMCVCVYIYIYIPPPPLLDTSPVHYFLSLREFFSVKLKSQAPLLTTGVVPKIQRSQHQNPTSVSGQELKPCFKLPHTEPT